MNARPIVVALTVAAFGFATACRERQEAVAAETPRLEIKAEVAKPQSATVVAPYDGRIAELRVAEGTRVNAGDELLTITNPTVERDLAYARAQVAVAEYRLRNAQSPRRAAPKTSAAPDPQREERIRAAEEIVRGRKARLDRYEFLFKSHDITADELENARLEYAAAQRDLANERAATQSAAADPATSGDPALLRLDLEKARAEAAVIEDRQRQLRVIAPMTGVVTRLLAQKGESIFPRDPILEITDAMNVEVRGSIAPELQRHVKAGTQVEVKVFTVPPRRFTTTIRNVIPPADAGGATIVVPLSNPDGVLQPGTPATIMVR